MTDARAPRVQRFAVSLHFTVTLSAEEGLDEDRVRNTLARADSAGLWVIADDIEETLREGGWHPIETFLGGTTIQELPQPGEDWPTPAERAIETWASHVD